MRRTRHGSAIASLAPISYTNPSIKAQMKTSTTLFTTLLCVQLIAAPTAALAAQTCARSASSRALSSHSTRARRWPWVTGANPRRSSDWAPRWRQKGHDAAATAVYGEGSGVLSVRRPVWSTTRRELVRRHRLAQSNALESQQCRLEPGLRRLGGVQGQRNQMPALERRRGRQGLSRLCKATPRYSKRLSTLGSPKERAGLSRVRIPHSRLATPCRFNLRRQVRSACHAACSHR